MEFKLPSLIPQDLQLIQDLVADFTTTKEPEGAASRPADDDSILSSDEDGANSEREVEADILGTPDDEEEPTPSSVSSSDDDSSSDSDSGVDRPASKRVAEQDAPLDDDDDEGGAGAIVSPEQVRTKNEVAELNIVVPEIEQMRAEEVMEKVGEIISIIDKVVVVRGTPSQVVNRASERALDSDTLLVFEDRKVLGYVWETFGPTTQPFYRVQFNDSYPLDPTKVQVSRAVFHIPARSNFVFVSQLKHVKGSDASNANDEEPAEDELEFSDDEAEREHKRSLKERRGGSETPSRHATPNPPHMRDMDLAEDLYGANPYDNAYNDMDFGAGPSRPPPIPYDDPYSDSYGLPEPPKSPVSHVSPSSPSQPQQPPDLNRFGHSDRPRGRGRGRMAPRDSGGKDRGRGRGQDRRRGDRGRGRGRGRGGSGSEHWNNRPSPSMSSPTDEYDPRTSRPMSPTSMAIARATGQYPGGADSAGGAQPATDFNWDYQQQYPSPYDFHFAYQQQYEQQQFVQPHINPRFASMFGMGFGLPPQQAGYSQNSSHESGQWGNDWTGQPGMHESDRDDGPQRS